MNDKFDKIMSKVGLFLGGVVVTTVGLTIYGATLNAKEKQTEDVKELKGDTYVFNNLEKVIDSQEEA